MSYVYIGTLPSDFGVAMGVLEAVHGIEYAPNWQETGYTGLDAAGDAVVNEIMAQGGSTSSDALQKYAAAAAGAGAGAACAAYGAAAAVPACLAVGSAIAKVVTGGIGKAASSGNAYTDADSWNDYGVAMIKSGNEGVMAIRSYLTTRDAALSQAADTLKWKDRNAALAWANQWLEDRGAPPAPVNPLWNPAQYGNRWEAFKTFAIRAEDPSTTKPTSYPSPESMAAQSCALSAKLGLTCAAFRILRAYPTGLPAPPGAPIDWGLVGAFQYLMAGPKPSYNGVSGKLHDAKRLVSIGFPMPNPTKNSVGYGGVVMAPGAPNPVSNIAFYSPVVYADMIPSQKATELSLKLQELQPQLVNATKNAGRNVSANITLASVLALKKTEKTEGSVLGKVAVAGGVGLGLWWLWKTLAK